MAVAEESVVDVFDEGFSATRTALSAEREKGVASHATPSEA